MVQPLTPEDTARDSSGEGSARASGPAELLGLLRQAYVARRSGHIHISHGRERRGLLIRGAYIVQGRSDVAGEHLGDILVRNGLLSQVDLDRAGAEVLAQRRPLGAVLTRLSLIDESHLDHAAPGRGDRAQPPGPPVLEAAEPPPPAKGSLLGFLKKR